jgi:hypothetical protein
MNSNEMSKIQPVEDYNQAKVLKIRDSTQIYDSDRILGATDMGTPTKAHVIGTPGYIQVKAQDRSRHMLYLDREIIFKPPYVVNLQEPDQDLETWPPISRGQERLARDTSRLGLLYQLYQ